VPVSFAIRLLTIKTKQNNSFRVALRRQTDCASARITITFECSWWHFDRMVFLCHGVNCKSCTLKIKIDFFYVRVPPDFIYRKQSVSPRRNSISRVRYDNTSFRGRPRFFTPLSDALNIVGCEAWATGEADDSASIPAAFIGRSINSFVSISTASPRSIRNLANADETSTGMSFGSRPISAVRTGFLDVTMIFIV